MFILELTDEKNNTVYVELSDDGKAYEVSSAGVFRKGYSENKEVVWSLPAVRDDLSTDVTEFSTKKDSGNTSGDSPQTTLSDDKSTEVSSESQSEVNEGGNEQEILRSEVDEAIAKLTQEFGVEVVLLESESELDLVRDRDVLEAIGNGLAPKGWYRKSDNRVYVLMSNVESVDDITETYIHEVVGHYGLRAMLGEDGLNSLLDTIWEGISDYERRAIIDREGMGKSIHELNEGDRRRVAEEFLAYRSENGAFMDSTEGRTLWQKIVRFIAEILGLRGVEHTDVYALADMVLRDSAAHLRNTRNSEREAEAKEVIEQDTVSEAKIEPIGLGDFGGIYNQFISYHVRINRQPNLT